MKRLFVLLASLFLICPAFGQGDEMYKIIRLSSPTIRIGGKIYKEGQCFPGGSNIQWGETDQSMECKGMTTGAPYRFSRRQFETKGGILSVKDYLLRISKASTRDAVFQPVFTPGRKKEAFPEKRCALVIGNSNYSYISYLRNPLKDAADVMGSLLDLGFDVMDAYDCNYSEMKTVMNAFAAKAKGYDAALIYYSGHGLQEAGYNYLIPVDCPLESKSDLRYCIPASDMVQKLEDTGCETRLLYLDACRNVKTSWIRSAEEGLASMEGFPGMVIAFSTRNGRTASDGEGDNSPFAKSFLENISSSATFPEMMANVARQTYAITGKVQFPVTIGSLMTDFRFNPAGAAAPTVVVKTVTPAKTDEPASVMPEPREKPAPVTRVLFDEPGFDFAVQKVERAGRNVYITIRVANNSGRNVRPLLIARESTKHPSEGYECAAYDNAGHSYSMYNADLLVLEGSDRRGDSQYIASWPNGITSVFKVYISGVSPDADAISILRLCFRQVSRGAVYGIALLEMRNIPLE